MELKDKIAVMQAALDGKEIEYRYHSSTVWLHCAKPIWDWSCNVYRVEPRAPRVYYLNIYRIGASAHAFRDDAATGASTGCLRKAVKFIEVLDECDCDPRTRCHCEKQS